MQDCYRRLLARASHYDLAADGRKLLFKSITNACVNFTQRRPPEVDSEQLDRIPHARHSEDGRTPDSKLIQHELEEHIGRALANLPVNQQAAVELASLGHPLTEVAEILDVSHANARVLLHRGRQTLAESLKKLVEGEVR